MAGRAFDFDGVTQRADMPALAIGAGDDFTIPVWLYADTTSSNRGFIGSASGGDYLRIDYSANNVLRYRYDTVSVNVTTTDNFPELSWFHLITRRTAGLTEVFVDDNVVQGSSSSAGSEPFDLDQFGTPTNQLNEWLGKMFDLRIYGASLSDADMTTVRNFGTVSEPLLRWYRCDDPSGTQATDSSGNAQHGTIIGGDAGFFYEGADVPHTYVDSIICTSSALSLSLGL